MKVTIVGLGYVGLSLAMLISKKHHVVAVDIIEDKIKMLKDGVSPIKDKEIERCLSQKTNDIQFTNDITLCKDSEFVIISTPTNYNERTNGFDTTSIETVVLEIMKIAPETIIVIKSTVPIGYTEQICRRYNNFNIIFSPEFLREGRALLDNLYPSRIIAGISDDSVKEKADTFVKLLKGCSNKSDVDCIITKSAEAESIKLFSNTYLAMRVAFFNELDMFAEKNGLNTKEIIIGACLDPRIGNYYNNPSFGYGGYCLPKDTKQLFASYKNVPCPLINAIADSNTTRKKFIVDEVERIMKKKNGIIGIYRLVMKMDSDNYRESSIIDIMSDLSSRGYKLVIYEPSIKNNYEQWNVENNLANFCSMSDIILTNRFAKELENVHDKVLCRDIFNRD